MTQTRQLSRWIKWMTCCVIVAPLTFTPLSRARCGHDHDEDAPRLELGLAVERTMGGGETHRFRIALDPGLHLRVTTMQQGIDLIVTILDPAGRGIARIDRPNDAYGPETASVIAEVAGDYLIEVKAAIIDFYRRTRSYLFEHVWWHATEIETNAANAELMDYALRRGAREYLDFGSGVGSNAILFAKHGFSVTLADVSETMLGFARWRLERRGLRAEFIDLNQQPLPRGRFDFVTAVDVCEHLSDPGAQLSRVAQSLKIGGAFVFNHHIGADEERPMHIVMTTAPLFRALRRNGLREATTEVMPLRRLEFCVVERGGQSRIEDWFYGAYDRLRFSEMFVNGAGGRPMRGRARHPQRTYFDRVRRSLDGKTRWLDVGCGRQLAPWWMKGQVEVEADLKSRAQFLIGADPDFAALGDNRSLPRLVNADAVRLPFADGSFDLVTSNMVFEHVKAPLASLKEIRRVLGAGGRLIVLTPNWLDIVTIAARVIPNRWHPAIVSRMEERGAADVYPTHFRFNRPATV
ncbi:MAG: class I SAM-dependent methyltransferase, partial [Blastocatellia bacterium]